MKTTCSVLTFKSNQKGYKSLCNREFEAIDVAMRLKRSILRSGKRDPDKVPATEVQKYVVGNPAKFALSLQ